MAGPGTPSDDGASLTPTQELTLEDLGGTDGSGNEAGLEAGLMGSGVRLDEDAVTARTSRSAQRLGAGF